MARKKMRQVQSKKEIATSAAKMEKDLEIIPTKLAAYYRNALVALKQQQKKLSTEIQKAQHIKDLAKKKSSYLMSRKSQWTASDKKQWNAASKLQKLLTKTIKEFNAKLALLQKTIKQCELKQFKYAGLTKQIKQWQKSTKISKPKTARKKLNTKQKTVKHEPESLIQPPALPTTNSVIEPVS